MPEDKKHFDVAQPGQLPVSHTSRPVIVEQQQTISGDPMMRSEDKTEKLPTIEHKQMNIKPLHEDTVPEKESSSPETVPVTEENRLKSADTTTEQQLASGINPAVQKLIDDKTYHLPIQSQATKTIKVILVVVALLVIVGAGIAYFAMNQ